MEGFGDEEEGRPSFARSAGSGGNRGKPVGSVEVGEDLGEDVEGELRDGHRLRWREQGGRGGEEEGEVSSSSFEVNSSSCHLLLLLPR